MCVIGFHSAGNDYSVQDVMLHVHGKLLYTIIIITQFVFKNFTCRAVHNCTFKEEGLYAVYFLFRHSICQSPGVIDVTAAFKNAGRQVANKFCSVAPTLCGSLAWNWLHVALLAH
jgi:hypothetical protein